MELGLGLGLLIVLTCSVIANFILDWVILKQSPALKYYRFRFKRLLKKRLDNDAFKGAKAKVKITDIKTFRIRIIDGEVKLYVEVAAGVVKDIVKGQESIELLMEEMINTARIEHERKQVLLRIKSLMKAVTNGKINRTTVGAVLNAIQSKRQYIGNFNMELAHRERHFIYTLVKEYGIKEEIIHLLPNITPEEVGQIADDVMRSTIFSSFNGEMYVIGDVRFGVCSVIIDKYRIPKSYREWVAMDE